METSSCKENCILELFRLDDAAAYRVGYVCIRQLALLLRNTSLSSKTLNTGGKVKAKIAQGKSNKAKASSKASSLANGKPQQHAKVASKKGKSAAKQSETLVSWPFVRAMFLWARLVSDLKALKDLAYPLYMVILGATKSQSSLHFAPFCLHGLTALNELMAKTQRLVPLSALLLRLLDMDLKAIEKASKGSRGEMGQGFASQRAALLGVTPVCCFSLGFLAEERRQHQYFMVITD